MKRILSIIILVALVVVASNYADAATKKKVATPKAAKPTVGKVVSLNEVATGSFIQWKKADAAAEATKGTPFVLMVGTGTKAQIYFVYNADGSFAGKKLANYAFNKKIGVVGKIQTKNGLKIIIADTIEAME